VCLAPTVPTVRTGPREDGRVRAVVRDEYGPPGVLRLDDVEVPTPGPGQVLVRVAAVSLNLSDWETLVGRPLYSRIGGWRLPKHRTLGSDIAGTVEAIGEGVTELAPGEQVYGDNLALMGGFAEFAVASAKALARTPEALDAVEASTIPQAGAIALQGIREQPLVRDGARVLVNGAGGGSGAFAVQLAKLAGAHVTGVDNAAKLDFVRSLGADEAIDFRAEDVTRSGRRFDLVLDLVAHRSVLAVRRLLEPGGRYLCVGGSVPSMLQVGLLGRLVGLPARARLGVLMVRQGPVHFAPLAELCTRGEIEIHVDRTFTLDEVPEALQLVGDGAIRGKAVVTVPA
jgi:NADPH:quinone reductase-like Zn-dependent oxidoreductase